MGALPELHTLITGLVFGESPRWQDDRLWFSDMGARVVLSANFAGQRKVVARIPTGVSGIGFLPDRRLLIVSGGNGLILCREPDGALVTHANLTGLSPAYWNDLVVDGRGNAYVDNVGFNFAFGEPFAPGSLAVVTPVGTARQVADGLAFPNGMAVSPDNATLIVAESYGARLSAFDIAADGSLSNRRVWADLPGAHPDGICFDAEGTVWYSDVPAKRCVRVREGGGVLETIELDRGCFACVLGGIERRTLFLMAAEFSTAAGMAGTRTGQVLTVEVPTPGAGWP